MYNVVCTADVQVGLSLLIRRASRMSPAAKLIVQKFVPFPAVGQSADTSVIMPPPRQNGRPFIPTFVPLFVRLSITKLVNTNELIFMLIGTSAAVA